jgi:hypothetical protein
MSRKDYQLIADVLAASHVTANLTDLQREDLALDFIRALHCASGYNGNGNKSFRADVFLAAACGNEVSDEAMRAVESL